MKLYIYFNISIMWNFRIIVNYMSNIENEMSFPKIIFDFGKNLQIKRGDYNSPLILIYRRPWGCTVAQTRYRFLVQVLCAGGRRRTDCPIILHPQAFPAVSKSHHISRGERRKMQDIWRGCSPVYADFSDNDSKHLADR